jgi:cytochrome P450
VGQAAGAGEGGNWKVYSSARGNLIDEFPGRAGSTLGSSDPPRHDRLRGLIQSAMTKRALDHVLEPTRASCAAHLAAIAKGEVFDFVNDFGGKITVDLFFYLFAFPREGAEQDLSWVPSSNFRSPQSLLLRKG